MLPPEVVSFQWSRPDSRLAPASCGIRADRHADLHDAIGGWLLWWLVAMVVHFNMQVATSDDSGGAKKTAARVRSFTLALWQGQGRHPDLEDSLAELCLLLSDDDESAYAAARQGFLQPLLGHLTPSAALVDAGLEVVLSFFSGGKGRHLAIAAGLTDDLAKGDDSVARAICALFVPLKILVGPVAPVATRALAAKSMLAIAQAVQSTPGNTGMDPVMKALWASDNSVPVTTLHPPAFSHPPTEMCSSPPPSSIPSPPHPPFHPRYLCVALRVLVVCFALS